MFGCCGHFLRKLIEVSPVACFICCHVEEQLANLMLVYTVDINSGDSFQDHTILSCIFLLLFPVINPEFPGLSSSHSSLIPRANQS